MPAVEQILVAAAVIANGDGDILLARRADHLHQGGLWEFPGGKVEPGESFGAALHRELAEELGIEVLTHRPLIRLLHAYADRRVLLDVHRITGYRGEPRGLEGQPLAWVAPDRLADYPMPAADRPIVNAVRLPATYLITPPEPASVTELVSGVTRALEGGVRLVQLRVRRTGFPVETAAAALAALCDGADAHLLINRDIELASSLGCGVHLAAGQLEQLADRPLPQGLLVGGSCHSQIELARALELGLDFAVLSPVKPTASHPGTVPLGWELFAAWVDTLPLPVFALGGLSPADIPVAWQQGAQGIAAIRGLWPD